MMADFDADAPGNIVNQSRIITGVTSVPGPGAWYLNLHQGGMNQILANGVPTLYFRPMLCADLSTYATAGPATAGQPMQAATPTMGATAPAMPTAAPPMTAMPMPAMPASVPTTTPVSAPSAIPTGVPTHY
jgi:cell division septation protein DedD